MAIECRVAIATVPQRFDDAAELPEPSIHIETRMRISLPHRATLMLTVLALALPVRHGHAQHDAPPPVDPGPGGMRDGQHDFDWEIGTWKTRLKRRLHPLTGSNEWADYEGTTVVRPVWNGRANLVELDVRGPAGRIEGLSLRLYDTASRQWSLNFASRAGSTLTVPAIGAFKEGRGEFYNQDTFDGRDILVRFVISGITPDSAHFEQAFSVDGGRTWEVNWIATDTRLR